MAFTLSRRSLIAGGATIGALTAFPGIAFAAAATDKRFIFIIQRGAADGLAIVPPLGDPALLALREALVEPEAVKLDSFFSLHPALASTSQMFAAGEARAYHAVATAYRDRSHFDGQNVLESGGAAPYLANTGWIGRLLPMLPPAEANAIALTPGIPLALRGSIQVGTYSTSRIPTASDDLLLRIGALYEADREFAPLWAEAIKTQTMADGIGNDAGRKGGDVGKLAASLLAPAGGARVMMIETGGWDTHAGQKNRLSAQLRGFDSLLTELKTGLGSSWKDTLVVVATEFGRTAAINGTGGTDHGTGSAAFLFGGALAPGAPVVADWPGLSSDALYQQRDLKPTTRLGDVLAQALSTHYGLDPARVTSLFAGAAPA